MTELDEDAVFLDTCFEAARAQSGLPSEALMARVLADAMHAQSEFSEHKEMPVRSSERHGWGRQIFDVIGGWPSMAGFCAAMVSGVWLGMSSPAGLGAMAQQMLGEDETVYLLDMSTDVAFGLTEGAM